MDMRAEVKTLKGKEAVALWRKGRAEWNNWVRKNPLYNIDFSGVDFSSGSPVLFSIRSDYEWGIIDNFSTASFKNLNDDVCFSDFVFPEGCVIFDGCKFGRENVSFSGCRFGSGHVSFRDCEFESGIVDFSLAKFIGSVDFSESMFNIDALLFDRCFFSGGNVDFYNARFRGGDIRFDYSIFVCGELDFSYADFEAGDVSFWNTDFGECHVNFEHASFQVFDLTFLGASIKGSFNFEKVYAGGDVFFWPEDVSNCEYISFEGTEFLCNFSIWGFFSPCTIDLRHTKLSHPLDLDSVYIDYFKEDELYIFSKASNSQDSSRFRRLKKIAKEADDQNLALEFFAQEMRSDYWHGITGGKLALFYLYDWVSDYGRSVARPAGLLAGVWLLFMQLYWHGRTVVEGSAVHAALLSFGHLAPIYAGSKEARDNAITALYQSASAVPEWIQALMICQGIISSLLLFLIALALRNRFRQ